MPTPPDARDLAAEPPPKFDGSLGATRQRQIAREMSPPRTTRTITMEMAAEALHAPKAGE